jgi:hypothetical protein
MQTPAMALPWCGRQSGLAADGDGAAAAMVAPQLEQKRALCGNAVPHRLQ